MSPLLGCSLGSLLLAFSVSVILAAASAAPVVFKPLVELANLRLAIEDLEQEFPDAYAGAGKHLARIDELEKRAKSGEGGPKLRDAIAGLRREALLADPLLDFEELLVLKRRRGQLGLPVNHKCNTGIERKGYDNEIIRVALKKPRQSMRTVIRPAGTEFVGEMDLDYSGDRFLFTMTDETGWRIWEVGVDGKGLRRITRKTLPDVDSFDACYLPDGGIVFGSTAGYTAVPCWHGQERACGLFVMDGDGSNVRQLCFDQDLDLYPSVLSNGQVLYSRWDYSGPMHMYLRPLMTMNPDGTAQRAIYGGSSWWPNALYFAREVPGAPGKIAAIVAGYHGVPRMGELAILDTNRGWREAEGVVRLIPGRERRPEPVIRDNLVQKSWPKFLHPWPLGEKRLLVSMKANPRSGWGIYLVDAFDNLLPVLSDPDFDYFEPIPIGARERPPSLPDRVDLACDDAVVYVRDVNSGPGLAGVPRGTVRRMRVVAYNFGYPGLAGPDKIGIGGPWEAMRILGTVPVRADGSVLFRAPANTPLTVQPLDADGAALQVMRSWFTAMPGEMVSCVGCHDRAREAPSAYFASGSAEPDEIEAWNGPARGFDFEREVQPVLNRRCAGCHDGKQTGPDGGQLADLRGETEVVGYRGRPLTKLAASRLHPDVRKQLGGESVRYTPAYEALLPYVRRVGIEDTVEELVAAEYHASTSELVQMLRKGHHGARLDAGEWERLFTWIDLNAPCHGTWGEVCEIPEGAGRRRVELARGHGGPKLDPEEVVRESDQTGRSAAMSEARRSDLAAGRGLGEGEGATTAKLLLPVPHTELSRAPSARPEEKRIDLGGGVTLRLVRIPAGEYVMGDPDGAPDERPEVRARIDAGYWMSVCEISNEQFRRFDSEHRSGYFAKRYQGGDGPGLSLDGPKQPVVRVSWKQARAWCRWASEKTGLRFDLPTEAQWEHACRAGSGGDFSFGEVEEDFSPWANMADRSLSVSPKPTGGLESNITAHFGKGIFQSAIHGSDIPCDSRHDDGSIATAKAGSFRPNDWGLHDMHGNASEWTRSDYWPHPSNSGERDGGNADGLKVVRGGSFRDRPQRCRSASRLAYPGWQRPHDVGFRVVCEDRVVAALQPD